MKHPKRKKKFRKFGKFIGKFSWKIFWANFLGKFFFKRLNTIWNTQKQFSKMTFFLTFKSQIFYDLRLLKKIEFCHHFGEICCSRFLRPQLGIIESNTKHFFFIWLEIPKNHVFGKLLFFTDFDDPLAKSGNFC